MNKFFHCWFIKSWCLWSRKKKDLIKIGRAVLIHMWWYIYKVWNIVTSLWEILYIHMCMYSCFIQIVWTFSKPPPQHTHTHKYTYIYIYALLLRIQEEHSLFVKKTIYLYVYQLLFKEIQTQIHIRTRAHTHTHTHTIYIYIPNPPLGQDMTQTQGQFLSRV